MTEPGDTNQTPTDEYDDERALLDFVAERDQPCPACGYNLRQLQRPNCPECGLSLVLSVGSAEPFRSAWAVTLMLNAMVAGLGVFLLVNLASDSDIMYFDSVFDLVWYIGSIAWIPVPALLFWVRRRFNHMGATPQKLVVVLSCFWLLIVCFAYLLGE